jgi:hypothetical protein
MAAVFNMAVGKHPNMFGTQLAAVAQRFGGGPFDKAFISDVSIRPLVDADKIRPARQRGGKGRQRRVSQHVNAQRHAKPFAHFFRDNRHQG